GPVQPDGRGWSMAETIESRLVVDAWSRRSGSLARTSPLFDEGGTDGSSGGPLRLRAEGPVPEGLETRGDVGVLDLLAGLHPVPAREATPPRKVQSPTHKPLTTLRQTHWSGVPQRLCDRLPAGRSRRCRDRDPRPVLPRVPPAGPDRARPRA